MKTQIPISGMHCKSCELRIEHELEKIKAVKQTKANFKNKLVTIYSREPVSRESIQLAIAAAGYSIGSDEKKSFISLDLKVYRDLTISLIIIALLYFIVKRFGIFNFNIGSIAKPSNLFVVLLIGLTAGISTCMAMVGGLILSVSARHADKHPNATPLQNFRPHLFFNLGRIGSFFVLGGLIGLLGKSFQLSGLTLGILTIVVGAVMLFLGLQLTDLFPRLQNFSLTLPSSISKALGIKKHQGKEYSHLNSVILGGLTFFLPCGFTQAMQLFAVSSGNFLTGGLIMATFALGTAPGLLGIGGLTSVLKGIWANRFFRFVGLIVIFLAIFNISNGLNLTGFSPKFSINNSSNTSGVTMENGVQVVRMDQIVNGYNPNNFTIKAGIPVKWLVNSKNQNSCAASLYFQKINLRTLLSPGINEFNFTIVETGQFQFTCSMGMYRGYFNVVENKDLKKSSTATPGTNNQPAKTNESPTDAQIIKTTYEYKGDINPNSFTVKVNQPVRFEVEAKDDGQGCMSSITIPDLVKNYEILKKGETIVFNFTPAQTGSYYITCAMGSPRGLITVI